MGPASHRYDFFGHWATLKGETLESGYVWLENNMLLGSLTNSALTPVHPDDEMVFSSSPTPRADFWQD